MKEKFNLAVIYGSNRQTRFCDVIGRWSLEQIKKNEAYEVQLVDPNKMDIPSRHEKPVNADLAEFQTKIRSADSFLIIVPEYNHGYPAALKFLIDSEYEGWRAKPVAFVSYGGISGGIRAVEQLRQIFCELHATTIRDSVHFVNAWEQFDKEGKLLHPDKFEKSMDATLKQLLWWTHALKAARASHPYVIS